MATHLAEGVVLAEGTLQKHSPSKVLVKRWQTRYFVLSSSSPSATTLAYYKRKGDGTPKGVIDLAQVRRLVMRPGSGKAVFEVETVGGRTYSLAAQSKNDAQRWVNALNSARGEPTSGAAATTGENTSPGKGDRLDGQQQQRRLMTGERVLAKQDVVIISHHALTDGRQGQLQMTPYRFILTIEQQSESVPFGLLARVENATHVKRGLPGYLLVCKDFRVISIFFLSTEALDAMNLLFKRHLFPSKLRDLYAFHNKEKYSLRSELHGWPLYQIDQEFERQRLDSSKWRITQANEGDYKAHPHLPSRFVVPASVSDEMLVGQAGDGSYKAPRWVIALCWDRTRPGSAPRGCLLRAARTTNQGSRTATSPLVSPSFRDLMSGLDAEKAAKRALEAETAAAAAASKHTTDSDDMNQHALLEHILKLYPQAQALHVYNIQKSSVSGTGIGAVETVKTASGAISFCTAKLLPTAMVEQGLLKLAHLVSSLDVIGLISTAGRASDSAGEASKMRAAWVESLHDTQWLSGVQMLLQITLDIVELIRKGDPVLVRSADIGDAVPQVTSLVQLCLDPYYRTIAGFCLLVEKEWMACAHSWGQQHREKHKPKHYSHMFVQFIDAVWQLWDMAPAVFEFDCSLLLFLLESVYSARFGSFLADSQRERMEGKLQLTTQTISVWSYVDAFSWQFGHSLYDRHDPGARSSLLPQPGCVKLWTGYYLRWACLTPFEQALAELQELSTAESQASTLSLSHRGLASVPPLVLEACFANVTALELSHNFLSLVPDIGASALASSLERLDLSHNLLTCVPSRLVDALPRLTRLTHLGLAHNRIQSLSALPFRKMRCLTHLDVSHNALQAVPSRLARLTQLRRLDLAGNGFGHALPPRLFSELTLLEELDLAGCALVSLPPDIEQLARLRVLNLSDNPDLNGLPSGLWSLTSLHELHARGICATSAPCKSLPSMTSLVTEVGRLSQLKSLDFSDNGLTDLPAAGLVTLTQLERLLLGGNDLASLGAEIGRLSTLRELDLNRNRLTSLPLEMAGLVQLTALNVEDNMLVALPAQLSTLPLEKLSVGSQNGCIRCPPQEIACMGAQSILAYLNQLLHGQKPCHRIKIMFVGQENVGKTSLLQALKRREKRTSGKILRLGRPAVDDTPVVPLSTDGIDINKWMMTIPSWGPNSPRVELSAWDFAGQEIYYSTHRFFLSERSMYLAVFNLVAPNQSNIEYWLHSVRTAAGSSPVLIIGTHVENTTCTEEFLSQMRMRLNKRFCQRFPNVVGIHFVSCATGQGIEQLLAELKDLVAKQEHIGQALPTNYLELEKILVGMPKERMPPILPWSEYESLARLCLVEQEHDLRAATSLLHNLGSIVHFPNDEKLKDVVILDPQWLMKVMSTIFSTKHSYCKNGVVAHSALAHIWKAPMFPPEVHGFLLSLLERFELSFPVGAHIDKLGDHALTWLRPSAGGPSAPTSLSSFATEEELYLIPSLLPEARPALVPYVWPPNHVAGETIFGRCYRFEFIPKGFMGRLIIRLLAFPLTVQICWLTGLLASIGREKILVEISPDELMLNITVRTELRGEQMSNLSWLVFAAVDSLVKEWYNLNAKVLVPCSHCMTLDLKAAPFMFAIEKCQQAATSPNESILFCPNETSGGDPKPVRLDHIAPDLAMVHLDRHRIDWADLIKSDGDNKPMAEGGYASVYRGTYLGAAVAIKELKGSTVSEFDLAAGVSVDDEARRLTFEEFRHEVWIMSGLSHPNLVRLRGFCLQPLCIVTELVEGGSLFDFLSDPDRSSALDWPLRLKIAKDIAKGCAFLHNTSPPVMHRDLKSPNILLANISPDAAVVAKLCDFGLSLSADSTAARKVDCPVWLAPEILEGKAYSEKADLYSIGVILWELLTKQPFFGEVRFFSVLEDMVKAGQRPPIPDSCIPAYRQLIEDCWAQHPDQRPSCRELVVRIEEIIREVCPEVEGYDATADADFHALRTAQADMQRRQQEMSRPRQDKLRTKKDVRLAIQMASVHSMMGLEPRRQLLTQSIKELAAAPCSKSDLIGCMEEFVKQRRESLAPQAAATFGSTAPRAASGSTIGRAEEEASLPQPQPQPQPQPRAASGLTRARRKRCDSQGSGSGGDLSSSGEGHDELKAPSPTLPSRRASLSSKRSQSQTTSPNSARRTLLVASLPHEAKETTPRWMPSKNAALWTSAQLPRRGGSFDSVRQRASNS